METGVAPERNPVAERTSACFCVFRTTTKILSTWMTRMSLRDLTRSELPRSRTSSRPTLKLPRYVTLHRLFFVSISYTFFIFYVFEISFVQPFRSHLFAWRATEGFFYSTLRCISAATATIVVMNNVNWWQGTWLHWSRFVIRIVTLDTDSLLLCISCACLVFIIHFTINWIYSVLLGSNFLCFCWEL